MTIIGYIVSDLARICKPSVKNFIRWYFIPQGTAFPFQVWYRIMFAAKQKKLINYSIGLLIYWKYCRMERKYGISLDSNIKIGAGLKIVHSQGTFINCEKIGDGFTVYQNVTLGHGKDVKRPTIGNNVTVYTGAVVTGGIQIGDNVVIGCNSYVSKDVDADSFMAGLPAKRIR